MDINATSLLAAQQASTRLQMGQAMIKANAKEEQQIANILAQAVEATANIGAAAGNGRGLNVDISV